MTRETKIGLLVGLAFIIVIGILLSDHLTSATEPPQAQLTQAGSSVRQAVSVPGAPSNPPITTVAPPAPVTPQQPIPTNQDLSPKAPPVQIVQIGPSAVQPAPQQPVRLAHDLPSNPSTPSIPQAPAPLIAQPEHSPLAPETSPGTQQGAGADSLLQVARQIGEEIVGLTDSPVTPPAVMPPAAPVLAGGKAYKAQEGDTLSKLAGRFLGANTKGNRDAIIRANPSLQKNPDIVVVGKTYIIPSPDSAAVASPASPASPAPPAPPAPLNETASPFVQTPSASPEYWYTVKENDTLRKIAFTQLGDEDAWAAIQDLNKNTLKGEDKTVVIPGMKLRLPARPVASAG